MANEKRKRQRAARAAKAAEAESVEKASKAKTKAPATDGGLPDIPNAPKADDAPKSDAPKQEAPMRVEVVSAKPGRRAPGQRDKVEAEARRQAVRDVRLKKQRNLAFRRFAIIMAALVATFVVIGFLLSGDDDTAPLVDQIGASYVSFIASDYGTGECLEAGPPPDTFDAAPQMCIDQGEQLRAVFDTNLGQVVATLNTTETVGTANNFVNLARSGYYDGLEVFRTDPLTASVFSGAASNDETDTGPGYTIRDEASGFVYGAGLLVMSRTDDNDSAGSEYFFTSSDEAEALDAQSNFVVFGHITSGLSVLEDILDLHRAAPESVTTGRPSETVTITSVSIESITDE